AMLENMYRTRTSSHYIFPGYRNNPHIQYNAILDRVKQLGGHDITTHGLRATFRTWCDKRTICEWEPKEMALGHSIGDDTERAYARDDWLERRQLLLETWSNFLVCGKDVAVD